MGKKIIFIGVIMGLLMFSGCLSSQEENTARERNEGRPRAGISFQLSSSLNEGLIDRTLLLETPQDEIVLTVRGSSNSNIPVMLKLFYNYEEIPFLVDNVETYVTQFLFELPYDEREINITIRMSSELEAAETVSALTIGVFPHPDYLSKNDDHFSISNNLGGVLNFRVSYGDEESLVLRVPYQEFPRQIENMLNRGVRINQDSAEFTIAYAEGGVFTMHPNPLQVAPDEVVYFYFYVNLQMSDQIVPIQNYLILSMLGWQQIEKDGLPYLLFEARSEDMVNDVKDHGRFSVTMPSEPGFYEFVTFIVPDPTHFNEYLMRYPLEFSFPFTVEVVE